MDGSIGIERATPEAATGARSAIAELIRDAVENGASIGFVLPLTADVLVEYADRVAAEAGRGERLVVLARDGDAVVGMVQLAPVGWPNGSHRAEIQKLVVHSSARRRGVGTRLMDEIEAVAREHGRTLLVLDTITGTEADPLYRGRGYVEAGEIPDYAGMPDGRLAPTTVFFKHLT